MTETLIFTSHLFFIVIINIHFLLVVTGVAAHLLFLLNGIIAGLVFIVHTTIEISAWESRLVTLASVR